ncbi:hypothetical protein RRF57_004606 [Xylaria bambusicola]|uniref:Protein kinase domain-containing protein n=1 Tax=Xylaria bambusicola TaxID=326684 RepID=A0AAN7UM39_9PEZI
MIQEANKLTKRGGGIFFKNPRLPFGVSTSTLTGPDKEAQVVGTPYWMAPEIIELSGAPQFPKNLDFGFYRFVFSLGKTSKTPISGLSLFFAIAQRYIPPTRGGFPPAARDFLMQCFQKDPNLRVSARKLLKHNWIVGCRRSDAPVSKAPGNFSQAVEEVKQWNKALTSSDSNLRASTGSDSSGPLHHGQQNLRLVTYEPTKPNMPTLAKGPFTLAKPRPTAEDFRSPELADDDNWDNDFATAISPAALQLPHIKPHDHFGGLLSADRLKAFASIDNSRDISNNWDLDHQGGELTTMKKVQPVQDEDPMEKTIRPNWKPVAKPEKSDEPARPRTSRASPRKRSASSHHKHSRAKSTASNKFQLPSQPGMAYREQSVEDYSDLFADNDGVLNQRLNLKKPDAPQLFHPSDLTSLPRSTQSPEGGSSRRKPASRPSILPDRPFHRSKSSIEIQKFAENDEEDFSDIFGPSEKFTERAESERGSEDGNLMVVSRLSNSSWLGDDEDEDDPFASMDPGWDEMDLEANIARDRHARLAERVEELVRSLKSTENEENLLELSGSLLEILWESREVKDLIIGAHGLLPILEILEPCTVKSRQHMILQLLKVVNTIILDDVELQENLCFVGGIPIITKFAARQYSNEIRLEAAAFVRQMYQTSTLTLQMFVSAGGLNVLVEFLDEDYDSARDLVLIGVNGIWNVFELQGPTPKNDFCRIFSRSKILDPLALVLHRVLDEDVETDLTELIEGRIVNIFYLFSQAENYVKEVVADRQVLKTVLKDLRRMTPSHQITMLKFIKNLSMLSTTLDTLHSADAIELLIELLTNSMKTGHPHFREISNQVLNTMFNLCRLSKDRQEYAAVNGIIPILLKIMKTDRPPKEFALPILCDMAHSGSKGRRFLWQNKGLDFYVSLLADQYWQVTALDAIFTERTLTWFRMQEETAKVEDHLLSGKFTDAIVSCFHSRKINAFDPNLLEPLLKLLRLSPSVAASLAKPEMYSGVAQRLSHKKAVVRLNLLRLVRNVLEAGEYEIAVNPRERHLKSLLDAVRVLAEKDSAVLVRNLASDLIVSHIDGSVDPSISVTSTSVSTANYSRPGPRRIYTPPSLHSTSSIPQTPTHASRHPPPSAYIEVASSPKRSAVSLTHERDIALQRPRSRDENSSIPVSSIPRRVSGDIHSGMGTPVRSKNNRVSRSSGIYPRPSLSSLTTSRSESESSNKENVTAASGRSARYPARYSPPTAVGSVGGDLPSLPAKQRRSRAPSEGKSKWSA